MKKQIKTYIVLASAAFLLAAIFMPPPLLAQANKGIELYNSWKFQEAENVLRETLKAGPQNVQANYFLGMSMLMQEKHKEALEVFLQVKDARNKAGSKTASSVPSEYDMQMALARARLGLKQDAEAWKNLESAEKENPNTAEVCVYRGVYYLHQENLQKAVEELEKAIGRDADNAYAYYYAGHAYLRQGNPAKAVEMLKTFLQLAPLAHEFDKAKALVSALC